MEQHIAHNGADVITELLKAHVADSSADIDVHKAMAARDDLRELANELADSVTHSLQEGEYYLDAQEPTPSPEMNTVEILELTGKRSDEYETDEGKLVSEYGENSYYPDDSPVVIGTYSNMSSDKEWAFPEARLE